MVIHSIPPREGIWKVSVSVKPAPVLKKVSQSRWELKKLPRGSLCSMPAELLFQHSETRLETCLSTNVTQMRLILHRLVLHVLGNWESGKYCRNPLWVVHIVFLSHWDVTCLLRPCAKQNCSLWDMGRIGV